MSVDPVKNMNTVIHTALRRDLERLAAVTGRPSAPEQRVAVCRHVTWMLDYLHHHHVSEDEGVWPRVLAKRPEAAELVQQMAGEHILLAEAADVVRSSAAACAADPTDTAWQELHDAVVAMQDATLPHLEHEEREAMPLVVDVLDDEDWKWLDRNYFRKGMSFGDSAVGLMWMLDDLPPEYAAVVRSEIPSPIVWVMSLMKGGSYDRDATTRWGELAGTRS